MPSLSSLDFKIFFSAQWGFDGCRLCARCHEHFIRSMPSSSSVYAEPSSASDVIDIQVHFLNGEGCMLKLSPSHTGWEVYQMVSKHLPPKKGGKPTLYHLDSKLLLHQTLQKQGIVGNAVTLSCTLLPTSICCMAFRPRFLASWGTRCSRRCCTDQRCNKCHMFAVPAKKPPTSDIWRLL